MPAHKGFKLEGAVVDEKPEQNPFLAQVLVEELALIGTPEYQRELEIDRYFHAERWVCTKVWEKGNLRWTTFTFDGDKSHITVHEHDGHVRITGQLEVFPNNRTGLALLRGDLLESWHREQLGYGSW